MEEELRMFSKEWAIEMTEDIKNSRDNWDYLVEISNHTARMDKLTFDSYIKEGFTEDQALYLTKD